VRHQTLPLQLLFHIIQHETVVAASWHLAIATSFHRGVTKLIQTAVAAYELRMVAQIEANLCALQALLPHLKIPATHLKYH
jgi:hypothetical protein